MIQIFFFFFCFCHSVKKRKLITFLSKKHSAVRCPLLDAGRRHDDESSLPARALFMCAFIYSSAHSLNAPVWKISWILGIWLRSKTSAHRNRGFWGVLKASWNRRIFCFTAGYHHSSRREYYSELSLFGLFPDLGPKKKKKKKEVLQCLFYPKWNSTRADFNASRQ